MDGHEVERLVVVVSMSVVEMEMVDLEKVAFETLGSSMICVATHVAVEMDGLVGTVCHIGG